MAREWTPAQRVERSIAKTYSSRIWNPFVEAVRRYALIAPGDRIAVCVSGGKDSMLLAKLMQLLQRRGETPFSLEFLAMDPGYRPSHRRLLEENAARLEIPLTVFETDVFAASQQEPNPCYRCARMRRGWLYAEAQRRGCNKIALGHHRDDVIETTLIALFYASQLQAMPPKLRSRSHAGMELIRPLYCVREADILAWAAYNHLEFLPCSCRFSEAAAAGGHLSKRREIKELLRELRRGNPNIDTSIFRAIHAVSIETFPGRKENGVSRSFPELYEAAPPEDEPPQDEQEASHVFFRTQRGGHLR